MAAATTSNKDNEKKFADLLGPMDSALDRKVREKLITARIGLLLKASFFGNLATRLKLVNADEWCSTAATDGRNFYYNSRFIDMLRPKEVEFLFGHEVLHCVYDHFGRRGDRDPKIWNIANDFCVNADLKEHHVGEFITTVPCLFDNKYKGLSSEEVYDDIMKNVKKISIDELVDQLLDEHLDGNDDNGGSGGDGEEIDGSGKGRPRLSQSERQQIRDEIKEAMLAAARTADGAGNIPAGIRKLIKDLTEPQLNWRELLRMNLQSTIKSDYTWMRSSRKGWHMDAVMPGQKNDEMIDIALAIDTSGSMTDTMLKDILSETQGIMDSFPSYRIHVISFDTEVYNPQQFDSDNLDSLVDYEPQGGGGTDFDCVFRYFKDNDIQPRRLVMFTDGYPFGSWGDAEYCDTTFIIHGNTTVEPPFGTFAYYEEKRQQH